MRTKKVSTEPKPKQKYRFRKSVGKKEYLAHQDGKHLSPALAIKAYCFDCMGFYEDGTESCESPKCPLFPFMPYNKNKSKMRNSKGRTIVKEEKNV